MPLNQPQGFRFHFHQSTPGLRWGKDNMSEVQVQFLHAHIEKMDKELMVLVRQLYASNLALHQIASASPCVSHPGTEHELSCAFCRTLIDVARDALGRERWPAESVRE